MYKPKVNMFSWENGFLLVALVAGSYSFFLAVSYASQLPLDIHDFRQTHNASVIYWLTENGFDLAYEFPVGGKPWLIPYEFPIYKYIVAAVSMTFDTPIHTTARIVSYIFLLACLIPSWFIISKLRLGKIVYYAFVALMLSAPVYVYWGRTVMMETTVLFLTLCAIKYFVDGIIDGVNTKNIILFSIFIILALLQKSLTTAPVLGILGVIYFFHEVLKCESMRDIPWARILIVGLVCFLIPMAIASVWTMYGNDLKMQGRFSRSHVSVVGGHWYWGTLQQRFSYELFGTVIWERIIRDNLNGLLGSALILLVLFRLESRILKTTAIACLCLAILPLFIITHGHIHHEYYQISIIVYGLFLMALSLSLVITPASGKAGALIVLILMMISNYYVFLDHDYGVHIKLDFHKGNSRHYAVGSILKRELPKDGQFVAFGNDWSPTFTYVSERKSFTVPPWFREYSTALANPREFLDEGRFGALVSCLQDATHISSLFKHAAENSWKIGETHGCLIAVPRGEFPQVLPEPAQCRGFVNKAEFEIRDGVPLISLAGWSTMQGDEFELPAKAYFVISNQEAVIRGVEVLRVPKLDIHRKLNVNQSFVVDRDMDVGLSAVIPADMPAGEYLVDILQIKDDASEFCQYGRKLIVEG